MGGVSVLLIFAYSKTPYFLILDSRSSILVSKRLNIRDVRIEFQGSSRDHQLTFDRHCTCT